ncbi:MAG: hypothetical protein K2W78_11085 [Xanthobacteraceae bacterium]|nr:hypothetical protein [Xanthobacteraceae bacterium]
MLTGALRYAAILCLLGPTTAFAQNNEQPPSKPAASDAERNAFESPTVGASGPKKGAEIESQTNKQQPPTEPSYLSPQYYHPSQPGNEPETGKR